MKVRDTNNKLRSMDSLSIHGESTAKIKKGSNSLQKCILKVNETKRKCKLKKRRMKFNLLQSTHEKNHSSRSCCVSDNSFSIYKQENTFDQKKSIKDIIFDAIYDKSSKLDEDCKNNVIQSPLSNISAKHMEKSYSTNEDINQSTQCVNAPQLKLDANGNIVIDEESLFVRSVAPDKLQASSKAIDITNDISFKTPLLYNIKRRKTLKSKWSIEDTIRFYQVLSVVGADFQTMTRFFPGKSRDNLKKKFKIEEKLHLDLIDRALNKSLSLKSNELFKKIIEGENTTKQNSNT